MSELSYDIAEPRPTAMIESLRAVGYSLGTAIADVVDNSISAKAKNVWIDFDWNGTLSTISITDDGHGMNEAELVAAMTLGSKSPLELRSESDLGRFGLGLKTASFSQCRKLAVMSRRAGEQLHVRCWDLDYVQQTKEWRLLKETISGGTKISQKFNSLSSGTTVLWDCLDHVVVKRIDADDTKAHRRFLQQIADVESHIAMIFHRFMERPKPLRLWINGQAVAPWDPFLKDEYATQFLPEEIFYPGPVRVYPYVLPHVSKVSNSEAYKRAEGPHGWHVQQGFYVYRNERLLVPGHWLGIGFSREENCKLARIQIDLPSSEDFDWAIDVKKSRARPPVSARDPLHKIARLTRDIASAIYKTRGKVLPRAGVHGANEFVYAWVPSVREGKISYRINREHPLMKAACSGSATQKSAVLAMLNLIEQTFPVEQVLGDNQAGVTDKSEPFASVDRAEMQSVLEELYVFLNASGFSTTEIEERLALMEPFNRFPDAIIGLCESKRGKK